MMNESHLQGWCVVASYTCATLDGKGMRELCLDRMAMFKTVMLRADARHEKAKIHGDESIHGWLGADPRLALALARQQSCKTLEFSGAQGEECLWRMDALLVSDFSGSKENSRDGIAGEGLEKSAHLATFLAFGLSYVFSGPPSNGVNMGLFDIAAILSCGNLVALAPLFLGTLYERLDRLRPSLNRLKKAI
ncbi:hypothetical protein Acr_28g0007420 [Actinidia rufa]|uniref:Uncharacterized protein n=1 Tax=Actinidia rufa TaxID=165716 RepID=A0A7J0HAA3_9ERIC|nr:hypothetical protein Acr_28g0007420 [Actinidia rufa]